MGCALGTLFVVSAALVVDCFGIQHLGPIFGLIFTAYGFVAGPLGPWLSGIMVDAGNVGFVVVFSYLGGLNVPGAVFISLVGRGRRS